MTNFFTITEFFCAIRVTPANIHQTRTVQKLFDNIGIYKTSGALLLTVEPAYDDEKYFHCCVEQ
ncbi:MAG: hypothetical protein ACTSPV_06985 [Candidatus Hodarchaeales archaeon]